MFDAFRNWFGGTTPDPEIDALTRAGPAIAHAWQAPLRSLYEKFGDDDAIKVPRLPRKASDALFVLTRPGQATGPAVHLANITGEGEPTLPWAPYAQEYNPLPISSRGVHMTLPLGNGVGSTVVSEHNPFIARHEWDHYIAARLGFENRDRPAARFGELPDTADIRRRFLDYTAGPGDRPTSYYTGNQDDAMDEITRRITDALGTVGPLIRNPSPGLPLPFSEQIPHSLESPRGPLDLGRYRLATEQRPLEFMRQERERAMPQAVWQPWESILQW